MGIFNGRKRRWTSDLHYLLARGAEYEHVARQNESWAGEVLRQASMPGEELVAEVFTEERLHGRWPSEVTDVVEERFREQAYSQARASDPLAEDELAADEPVPTTPAREVEPVRADEEAHADLVARLYAKKVTDDFEEPYRARERGFEGAMKLVGDGS